MDNPLQIPDVKWSQLESDDIDDDQVIQACRILADAALILAGKIKLDEPFDEIVAQVTIAKTALGAISSACSVKFLQQVVNAAKEPPPKSG